MSSLKIRNRYSSSVRATTGVLLGLCVTLCISVPAKAHGPGTEKIEKITAQIAASGDLPELYVQRARVYQDNEHWQKALSDFSKAAQLDPEYVEYDLDRARLHYQAREYLSALDFVELYLLRRQNTTEALLIKARIHRRLDQPQAAIQSYELALSDLTTIDGRPSPEWYMEFATALVEVGDTSGALQTLQRGINELGPTSVFQTMAADLEVELGNYDSALNRIDYLLDKSQRKDIWLSRRADILSAAGRRDEAHQTYQDAYAALQRLPLRLKNLPVSRELSASLQVRINNH